MKDPEMQANGKLLGYMGILLIVCGIITALIFWQALFAIPLAGWGLIYVIVGFGVAADSK